MSLNDKLFSIASTAVEKQRKTRDGRNSVSKGFDVATNKSYANEDKKVAAKALREWENNTWKPKVDAKLRQELKARAPHLKPGTKQYQQTYDSLFNKNYKDLQAAKAKAQQKIGTLRKPQQTQRELDNEYRTNESIRNDTVGTQAAAHAARDTVSAVGGALATGTSRLLRAPLQLAADVGENDDGGIFDRGAKALESYEDDISNNVYQAYGDIQQNGNFSQKLAVSAVEQVPALAASFGAAGAAAKGVQVLGAGAKTTAAASLGVAGASMYPQAYLDGSDSTKDELEKATPQMLASAERSQDIYKAMFDKNVKAGMSEDEAFTKARDQTISEIAEESGENVGLATLALSMMAPGVGSFTANRAAGGAVSKWGQKVFNKLAVRADAGKVAGAAIPTAVGAGIVGLNVAEEGAQEGYTDYVAQKAAVDVGVKDKIDTAQNTEAVLMGGILGGLMGGATYVGTRNSKLKQAQDGLKAAQQNYADIASTIPQLQEQIDVVSPRSPKGQALTAQLEETKAALGAMTSEAERRGIPRTSLARRAPRIDPSNSIDQEFDGQVDGATELDEQGFDAALNPQGVPAAPVQPVVDSQPSEQELDAQDAQIAELIAEQQALDEAIDDDSAGKPVEESLAAAQAWYDNKRGENKQGLSGVVSRAAAKVEDAAFAEHQQVIAGTGATINDYIASKRAEQAQIDAEIAQVAADAKTERERQAAEQLKQQREIERAEAEAVLTKRAELAQPYENESFDTTVVGADGAPFNLARFWDSTMPAAAKTKAIADAFNGEVDQNIAKAGWGDMPEGVQKQVHQWMTGRLDAVRQSRAGGDTQSQPISEPPLAPQSQQSVAPTASGLTMPVRAEQAPTAPVEAEPQADTVTPAAPVAEGAATQLTDENPVVNIPAPTQAKADAAPTTDEGIYKSKPAAKAAIKKQKLDPDSVTIKQVKGGGFEIVPNAPAKPSYAQAQEQAANELGLSLDENGEYGGTDAEFETFAKRVDEIQGRSLSNSKPTPKQDAAVPTDDVAIGKDGLAKWFGKIDKAQAFIDKKGISDTHEVVSAGKSRFEIQPKAESAPQADVAKVETASKDIKTGLKNQDNTERKLVAGDRVTARNNKEYEITNVEFNNSGGVNSVSTLLIPDTNSPIADKVFSPQRRSIAEFNNMFGSRVGSFEAQPTKSKNITDEQFAELTSSRTTPSTPTGEQSAPAKRAEAKKAATQKTQNDVSEQESKSRFADNKLFTEDKVAAARARLKSKLTQVNSGLDPEILMDGMTLAGAYIESGVRKFGDYAKMMIEDVGVEVKPYLLSFWNSARDYPGLDNEGMTNEADSRAEFNKLMAEPEQASEPAKSDTPKKVGSGTQAKTLIGENNEGLPLYEDDRGVRSILEHGIIYVNESVNITPTGIEQNPREQRYLTKEELAQESSNDTGTSNQDNQSRTDRGLSTADQADAESRNAGSAQAKPTSDVDAVDGDSNRSDTNPSDADSKSAAASQRADANDSSSRADSVESDNGTAQASDATPTVKPKNHVIGADQTSGKLSWQKVAERNVDIIELLKQLDSEGRQATSDEQALLAQYAGWGSSEIANGIFPNPDTGKYKSDSWRALGEKLKSLLTDSEYDTARRTTQYAHYTPPVLVNGIYKALEGFGFKGGQVLEPASGIGVFNGLMPSKLANSSNYVGLELDPITGRIAQQLYPESSMRIDDYIKAKLPDNHFDVAVGNPPFAGISVDYKGAGKNSTKQSMQLHDYFFAKTLDKLKPGGVMAFVTSKGTMDKKGSSVREYLAEQADLIGAIRLPQTAFKENAGTEVVTDIIFLRKRHEGEQPSDTAWASVKSIKASGKPTAINEYFVNNPDMVLGEHAIVSGRFGDTYTVTPNKGDFAKQVDDAIAKLPKDVFNPQRGSQAEAVKVMDLDYDPASAANKEGGVYLKDGKLMRVVDGVGKPLTQRYGTNGKAIDLSAKDIAFMTDYVGVRDALKEAQRDQLTDSDTWEDSLANLNEVYDAFVKKHGRLMAHSVSERENADGSTTVTKRFKNKQRLFLDVEGVLASALENVIDDGKGTVVKGSFFEGRSLRKPKAPTIKSTQDALVYTLDEKGVLDIARIAALTGKTEPQIIEELGEQIYNDPQSKQWDLAETYLSGNVVDKLKKAEIAAKTNKSYSRNVAALKAVQPAPIAPNDIASNMGASWIPGSVINEFSQQILKANVTAEYSPVVGLWDVGGTSKSSDYSTADRSTVQLVESILNSRKISITRKSPDGSSYIDSVATELANEVARKIKTEFKNWLWSDDTRTQELADYYNKTYNNIVPPTFNGDHLTLAGMSNKIQLRAPQKRGIYRVIRQGDVYLNHAVGAGKTFTMIAAAMEEKRLGLINKPMFVVPNHMLDQFSQEFLMLYPAANIMVADEQNFHTHNRKQFVAQAALNTPDAIIITHSGFERIGVKPETKQAFLKDKINEWQNALEATKDDDGDNRTSVKQLERNIESLERNLDDLINAKEKDGAVFFEDMGVDKLYIDEAHEFRKLNFVTKMGAIKGIDPAGSQKAMDLDLKLQLLRENNPSRAFVGASGTPVTNTMGELYTIQRYFQPDQLEQDGLEHFDVWANQFGEVVEGLEQNAAGNYEVVPRFARFVNVPELMSRVRSFMDVLTSNDLSDYVVRPEVKTGGREIVAIPTPDGFKEYQASLAARIDAIRKRSGKPEKGQDIILSVIGDGRFSAIDMRFVDPTLPSDPNSKLNRVISDMVEAYHATADNEYVTGGEIDELNGGALMMFTDIGLGEQSAASRGFDMKQWITDELVRQGVDPDHIAFMRDNKTHAKKGKLFDDMRQGRKRIMIGGKDMETGVNAQKRLTHLFHLDAPWFPASVEQREGRIIRQGNQNKEVVIRAYATKGSYDSTMWSMVARKARFIEQAMRGDMTVRNMDDVSEASAFEQASALSSGDPRSLQLAGLRQDVERLNRQLSGFQNEKFKNQGQAKQARQTLARAERELDAINKLLPTHKTVETGDVIGKVGGKSFDNRTEFGQAIIAAYNKYAKDYYVGEQVLGTVAGYDVVYNGVMMDGGNFYADANVNIPKADDAALFDTDNVKDTRPDGLTTRIINRVNKLADYKAKVEAVIEQAQTDAENFERRAGKSFDAQTELDEKSRDLKELEEALAREAEALKAASESNGLTEEDRVPGTEEPKYSKTNPAKGLTGTTSQQVISLLQDRFGKDVVASLIKAGKLRVRTLNDFVNADGRLLIPSDAEGFYHQGKVVLIADNLTTDTAVATLLHELGGHAGIQSMLSTQTYMGIMENFYDLVKSGNKYAVRAKQRAEASTYSASEARDEYIPYLITEYAQATERGGPLAVIKRFVNRVVAGVRAWVRANTGIELKLTPNDITQLAERMVKRLAEQSMDSVTVAGMDNTAAMPQYSQESTNQTTTAAFKKWFGDSKVVDSNGDPLVVYHGTIKSFNEFNTTDFGALLGRGSYFTSNESEASSYSGGGTRIVPAYLSIKNPYYIDSGLASVPSRQQMLKDGHDGVIYRDTDGSVKWAVAHKPTQIKSATNNIGTFDSSDPDIRFSRRYSNLGTDTSPTTAKEKAIDAAKQSAATALSSKFNLSLLLRRHLATPLHVGMLNPSFKTFFENVQARIAYENNEAGRIQEYLPEIWDTKLMIGKRREAIDKVSRALFDGTMADQVWTDSELETRFNLDDNQIDMYRRARAAIDSSVLNMTVDTLSSLAKGTKLVNIHTINRLKLAGLTPIGHNLMIQQHMTDELKKLAQSGSITPAAEKRLQNQLDGVFDVMDSIAVKYDDLVEKGYAPLMRFGHYAVEVRDKSNNELDLFELYETKGQQRKAIKELKEKYNENDFEVGTGTLNPDAFKQFTGKGLSPETVQLFAAELGLDTDGAHQAYLKVAISNQSALKRLIHRKKVPGYSEDLPRVLSSFVMSNARYSGRALYNGEIENAIQKIEDGNLQGEAQNVFANMENPQEEFAGVRGLLFHYYMGFSTAFMVLNFTQPFTQTIPKLTAYVGAARAHRDMTQALGIITKYTGKATFEFGKKVTGNATPSWKGFEDHLPAWVKKEDYLRMTREGHLDPQNIWMIRGLERGKAGVISGLWGNLSRAAGWAAEVSETINRRGTMIAAFKVAQTMGDAKLKAEGFNSRYDFVVSVIQQTQGVYNKGNRSGLARGTGKLGQFGPLIMVFKQFSINYAEQMIRHGRDKEVKSIAVAMAWQFMLAGMLGLPFTDDLRDIVEGLLYRLFGRATNLTAFLQDELGKENADALMYGLLSEKTRFDMYGRSNMGNFIPGTDFARPKEGDWAEVIGASSGFFENFFTAGDMITKGQYKDAAVIAAPRYVRDAAAGIEIWNNGAYRNQKGDKVMDMDRTDAVIKGALQFNPASNAQQGRARSEKYHMKNMVLDKQNQFALQLTEAIYQDDDKRVDELYNDMDAWNERNPEHFNVDIDKIEASAERRIDKKDFTSEDRQKLPEQLDDYFEERE